MSTLLLIVCFTALGGILSAVAASSFLLVPESRRNEWVPHLVSFATGALLAAALLSLLPDAVLAVQEVLDGTGGAVRVAIEASIVMPLRAG